LQRAVRLLKYREKLKGKDVQIETLFFPDQRIICRNFLLAKCRDVNCAYTHDENAPLTKVSKNSQHQLKIIFLYYFLPKITHKNKFDNKQSDD
jgi:hypothetical protein